MKKLLILFAVLLLLAACAVPALTEADESTQEPLYRAGEYTGRAKGYAGERLAVTVSLTGSHIDEIRVRRDAESEGIGAVVVEELPGLIVSNQTLAVDVVAGATVTSRALLSAVEQAIAASGAELAPLLEAPSEPVAPSLRAQVTEADLIVVGAGGAGLTAALSAARQNPELRIVLLEKSAAPGGNTLLAADGVNGAATAAQREAELEDDFETMLGDSLAVAGEPENFDMLELLEVLAGDSAAALDWLTEEGFPLERLEALPGSAAKRAHLPEDGTPVGAYLIRGLTQAVERAGVTILYRTPATALIADEEGQISGVIAQSPGLRHLFTGRAVVLATGGFAANDKLCGSYRTLLRGLDTVSVAGAVGDGVAMAQELGAATTGMTDIMTEPTVHRGSGRIVPRSLRERGAILLNGAGERFADELADDRTLSEALLAQSGRCGWLLFGEGLWRDLPEALQQSAVSGSDAEKLAQAAGLPAEALAEAIEQRNAELLDTIDEEQNEPHPARLEGTLFLLEVAPGVRTTLGGLLITPQAEVVGADGLPISGLFAAGEVTGGIHGNWPLPGNALTELLVFGRRAGVGAADFASMAEEAPRED